MLPSDVMSTRFGESKELVGETDQCRYRTGEGAPRANKGHEDEQGGGGVELHNAPCLALQGKGSSRRGWRD